MLRYIAVLIVLFVECQAAQYAHFTNRTGRISWVIETNALPWTGAYHFLEGSADPTTLLTVVESSSSVTLGECKAANIGGGWRRFFWTLEEGSLLCNVSDRGVEKVILPMSTHQRTFGVRILSDKGPRCFRDIIIQNERPKGCPPELKRNRYQYAALACTCPSFSEENEEMSATTTSDIIFPIFELTPASKEVPDGAEMAAHAFLHTTTLPDNGSVKLNISAGHSHPNVAGSQPSAVASVKRNACDDVVCENGSTCVVNDDGDAVCLSACDTTLCMNEGECEMVNGHAVCKCPAGTTGKLCEQAVCQPPCANGGTCIHLNGTSVCQCEKGYLGVNCNVIDTCANTTACAVFGPDARCSIDPTSYTVSSEDTVEASYNCQCLDQNNHWVNCLDLYITSTAEFIPSLPMVTITTVTLPPESVEITTEAFGSASEEMTTSHGLAGIRPIPYAAVSPNIGSHAEKTMEVTDEEETAGQTSVHSESGETALPSSFTGSPEFTGNQSVVFPLSVLPFTMPSSTSNGMDVSASKEETENPITAKPISSGEESTSIWLGKPSPNMLHSFANNTVPEVTVSQTPLILTTEPAISEETVTREVETTAVHSANEEMATMESNSGHSPIIPGWPSAQTMFPSPHWPGTTVLPSWPEVASTTNGGSEAATSAETSAGIDAEWGSHMVTEATPPAQTVETTLPHWLRPVSATEEPVLPEELATTEHPSILHPEESTEEPPPKGAETNEIEMETTLGEETVFMEMTTSSVVEGNEIQEIPVNLKNAKKAKESAKSSSSSWIVAMVAILTLLMLLGAAGLFVLRYVKRSRKLHGKYNPAREENALSSNYSMPMTTVPKEERLI